MSGDLYVRVMIDDYERAKIKQAIATMKEVAEAYRKSGLDSCLFAVEDLNDGISVLRGVLEGQYY